ncbi:MAG: hypothetical protein ACFFD1_01460, partial [Candidatus Thorarchaeota archaeon]
ALALLGWLIAREMYLPNRPLNGVRTTVMSNGITKRIDTLLANKYYIDDFYLGLATFFREGIGTGFVVLDNSVDYIVDGLGRGTASFCDYAVKADEGVIDGTIRYFSSTAFALAARFRKWQSGVLQSYISLYALGILIIFFIVLILAFI